MLVIVVTFDNTDPVVYGPYDSAMAADKAKPGIQRELERKGASHHVEAITTALVRQFARL